MRKYRKAGLIILVFLIIFQLWLRYDISATSESYVVNTFPNVFTPEDNTYAQRPVTLVIDRLTGKHYWFRKNFSLFPWPHATR
jgi:hypothetical protein